MQLRKTPFALAALALCSPLLPLSAQTSSLTMEAESMTRSSYAIEGSRIKLTASTGSATKTFSGASGTYNIQVHVLLENDGRSTLELYKGSTRLHTYTYPLGTTAASFTVSNVALASGDTIRLVGRANAGAWARVDKIVFTPVAVSAPAPAPSAGYAGTPYTGTPIALPKAFEAANFDKGGQGVAYRDLSAGNAGKLYRTAEDVDIIASSDTVGGAYAVNNFQTGEWLAYTVNVPADGNYDLAIRAANNQSTPASFHIEVDGVNATGPVSVPRTASWSSFQWVGKQGVPLKAGKRVIKVVSDQQYFNMSAVSVLASAGSAPAPTPTSPTPTAPIVGDALGSVSPVTIEAESMTRSSYAVEGNLIKLSASSGTATKSFGGASGTYDMQVYVLPENDGRSTLEVYKGSTPLHSYTYPLGTSMTSFTVSNVALNQGDTLQLRGVANGGAWARVDKVVLTPSTSSAPTPAPTPTSPVPEPAPVSGDCANPAAGYEGFGRNTTGGAGRPIYRVTNTNDSGSGSLREALSQGNRCIVFDVGGTISLGSDLVVRGANVTIDGLTAPAPGITLRNRTLVMQGSSGSNVVVRGIRHRGTGSGLDALRVYNAENIVIDRVSVSGFGDGALDVTERSRDVTVQWSILGNGQSSHNFTSLIKYNAARVTLHHNLYINGDDRNPHCGGSDSATAPVAEIVCDVRNNLIWNYRWYGTAVKTYAKANVVNNYYYTSHGTSPGQTIFLTTGGSAYVAGNYSQNGHDLNANGNRSSAYAAELLPTSDAITAAQQVLAHAGARGARFGLDAADQSYLGQVSLNPSGS